jgi:hypothetical protein
MGHKKNADTCLQFQRRKSGNFGIQYFSLAVLDSTLQLYIVAVLKTKGMMKSTGT